MSARFTRLFLSLGVAALAVSLGACAKKVATAKATPAPPPPPAPTASLSASPSNLQKGQSTTLTWSTQNANDITIDGLGTVTASGSRTVSPEDSTTYKLVAKGPGGTQEADARVTVATPPPPVAQGPTDAELFAQNVKDLYFNYDKYDVRSDEQAILKADAAFLAAHPNYKLTISGHCDERGSEEYNLALGSNRANTVRDQLVAMGVSSDRIKTISYGKEKPFCTQENDQCWQSNRRAHFEMNQ
ncbi:MAG: peptidoglycan-associated lipoprotein Pal [Terriglobia bacterium]|nr:peptidoglycan-associated lipoprotein Pal [Terriglobia bacterium]